MDNKSTVRRPKVDAADGQNSNETFLPGQIPVDEAESADANEARAEERQPDAAQAAQAVNPEFLTGIEAEGGEIEHQEIKNLEDRHKGER